MNTINNCRQSCSDRDCSTVSSFYRNTVSKQTYIADVKRNCPVFKTSHCPYTGLKSQLARSYVFDHGCIVKPGQCKTLEEVADVLASVVPKDDDGKKIMAHGIQQSVLLGYNEEKRLGKTCPYHKTWPFNKGTDGKLVFTPQSAIDSVYVTMDTIKTKCPAFQKGKACPYNVPGLKGLAKNHCPEFKNGCPFKDVKNIGEFREKLGEMRDKCKGKANQDKAFELIFKVNGEKVAELGHCPFHSYGCQVSEDLKGQPITTDFVELDTIKNKCPVFQKGKFCPYDIPCLKGLGAGCPEFKNGCPFKNVKTIGEFKEKLGEMRDKCKAKENYEKALDMIKAATGEQMGKFGHCPFFKFGCMLKTDGDDKPILSEWFTMEFIKEHCPAFQKGNFCPYNVSELKGLAKGCPAFKDGCPFKRVRTVGELEGKMAEMRDECNGKAANSEALKIIYGVNGKQSAMIGHCPFFKFGCPFKTDRQGKPIVPELVSLDDVKQHCPVFQKGKACPYNVKELKGLASGCPEFKNGCPFKGVKDVGEFKAKLGEMRDNCKAKENHAKAIDLIHAANGEAVAKQGHCPFFKSGCPLKSDLNGRFIMPDTVTMDYVKVHCPAFEKGKACPYNVKELKGLGEGCPTFVDGKCPYRNVKDVGEFKAKMGEMRDTCKGKAKYDKAFELIFKANAESVEKHGHCPFHHNHCELKTDPEGKPIF